MFGLRTHNTTQQVVHHLFPGVCHCHYPALAKIVQKTAKEFGVPYKVYPTVPTPTREETPQPNPQFTECRAPRCGPLLPRLALRKLEKRFLL